MPLVAVLFFAKAAAGQDEPISEIPCGSAGYDLPAKLTAWASALDADRETAERKAVLIARDELSRSIGTLVESVTDLYASSADENGAPADAESNFFSLQRSLTVETLRGVETICREGEYTDEGLYRAYVAMAVDPDFFSKRCAAVVIATGTVSPAEEDPEKRVRRLLEAE